MERISGECSLPASRHTRVSKQMGLVDNRSKSSFQHLLGIFSKLQIGKRERLRTEFGTRIIHRNIDQVCIFCASKNIRNFVDNLDSIIEIQFIPKTLLNRLQIGIPNSRLGYYLLAVARKDVDRRPSNKFSFHLHTFQCNRFIDPAGSP